MTQNRKKVGLALGSGAVRGLAHIGVLKVLQKNNIPIDYIAGCSIGAWVSACYALYQDVDKVAELTVGNKKEKMAIFLEPTLRGGIVKGEKAIKLLKKYFGDLELKDLKIPTRIVATDLGSGDRVVFSEGSVVDALRASMSVPYVFAPLEKDGMILVDGGISNPVPDNIVRDMRANIVISVNLDNFLKNKIDNWQEQSFTDKMARSLDVMRHYLANYAMTSSDIIIEPDTKLSGIRSWKTFFTKGEDKKMIKIGEEETEKQIEKIKKLIN